MTSVEQALLVEIRNELRTIAGVLEDISAAVEGLAFELEAARRRSPRVRRSSL